MHLGAFTGLTIWHPRFIVPFVRSWVGIVMEAGSYFGNNGLSVAVRHYTPDETQRTRASLFVFAVSLVTNLFLATIREPMVSVSVFLITSERSTTNLNVLKLIGAVLHHAHISQSFVAAKLRFNENPPATEMRNLSSPDRVKSAQK